MYDRYNKCIDNFGRAIFGRTLISKSIFLLYTFIILLFCHDYYYFYITLSS